MNSGSSGNSRSVGPEALRKIRHELSAGLAFVETSVNNLSGKKPDLPKAMKLYTIGSSKLRAIISDIDSRTAPSMAVAANPADETNQWLRTFEARVAAARVYDSYRTIANDSESKKTRERAVAVAARWYDFGETLYWFICQSATLLHGNENRRHVIEVAFDKLGLWNGKENYSELFWDAAQKAGVTANDRQEALRSERSSEPFAERIEAVREFRNAVLRADRDSEILGMLLSIEILNDLNIDAVYRALAWNAEIESELFSHRFFKQNRLLRDDLVQFTVQHFVRAFSTEEERSVFVKGFDRGIGFWVDFWRSTASLVEYLNLQSSSSNSGNQIASG